MSISDGLELSLQRARDKIYAKMRSEHNDEYIRVIAYASGVSINNRLDHKAAAEIEYAMMCLASSILEK